MDLMAKVDLEYVQAFPDRYGKMRYYFRRKGYARVALPGDPGSTAFAKAYETAKATAKPKATSKGEGPRSLGALIAQYYMSGEFLALGPSSQKTYRSVLERFRREYGCDEAADFTRKHLNAIFHAMASTPAAAANLRKRLRPVFELGVDLDWIETNPVLATKRVKYVAGGHIPWTEDEIEQFRAYHPPGTKPRRAMELLLNTGTRRIDGRALGRQHVKDDRISVVQEKTDERIFIRLHPDLAAELALYDGDLAFVLTEYGKPFTPGGFTKWFVKQARKAGVMDRTPHGLRKAAGRRLAEAGCSEHEIMAVLGHTSPQSATVYTKDVNRKRLADGAMDKLTGTD